MEFTSNYNEYSIEYFKENRVGVVVTDFTGNIDYQNCSDQEFYNKAEEQGTVFTLQGFTNYLNNGEYIALCQSIKSTEYVITRFMPVYEHNNTVYLNNEEYTYKDLTR